MEYMTFIRITILGMTILFVITMSLILFFNRLSRVKSRTDGKAKNINSSVKRNTLAAVIGEDDPFPVKVKAAEYIAPKHYESNNYAARQKYEVVKVNHR